MGAEIREAMRRTREESGLAWDTFATQARFSRSYLRAAENGTRGVTADVAAAYDRVLKTGGVFGAMVEGRPVRVEPWNRQGTLAVLSKQLGGGGVDRRRFVVNTGAALAALVGQWQNALRDPRPISPPIPSGEASSGTVALLDNVDSRLTMLRHLDDELGSGDLARLARSELTLLHQRLRAGGLPHSAENRALSLASEAARQTAWNLFDSERHAAAEAYFETALRASATASDTTAGAYAMSFMAIQHYTAGNPHDAVKLLTTALDSVSGNTTPRMQGMLAARKARALSKTGSKRDCARALQQARDLIDRGPSPDDPPFLYWVTLAEVEMIAGSSALELGDPAAALHFFNAAVAAEYPGDDQYPRTHAIYLTRAAEAHLALHDLDAAVLQARHAARCLDAVNSARSSSTLAGLRTKLASHASNPAVREFLQVV